MLETKPSMQNLNLNDWERQNLAWWNERVSHHFNSKFYDMERFYQTRNSLTPIELAEVGAVQGKTLLHLQCHFGQDTLSWAHLGAQVTGIDFSDEAIKTARQLAEQLNIDAHFIQTNVYDTVAAVGGKQFDIVFTSYGVIYWLGDLDRWAQVAAACLAPGGIFYIAEMHPFLYVFDENDSANDGRLRLGYPYFHRMEPGAEELSGTYAQRNAPTTVNKHYFWAHSFSDIINALLRAGLRLEFVHEHDKVVCPYFQSMQTQDPDGFWRTNYDLPLMFSIRAHKPN